MARYSNAQMRDAFVLLKVTPQHVKIPRDVKRHANRLLKTAHPDVGGSTQEAQKINAAKDLLLFWLEAGRPSLELTEVENRRAYEEAQRRAREAHRAQQEQARRAADRRRAEEERQRAEEERNNKLWRRGWRTLTAICYGAGESADRLRRIAFGAAAALVLVLGFAARLSAPHEDVEISSVPVASPRVKAQVLPYAMAASRLGELPYMSPDTEILWNEHQKWAQKRAILICEYEPEGSVYFWKQEKAQPYGIAWNRFFAGHPFANIRRGASRCPPDYSAAMADPPHGLALQLESWQAPEVRWRDGEPVEFGRRLALNCLYLRKDGLDWLIFEDRSLMNCPPHYGGPPVPGVKIFFK